MVFRLSALLLLACLSAGADTTLFDFSAPGPPEGTVLHNTEAERAVHGDTHALQVRFRVADWPNIFFKAPDGGWDWREYRALAVSLFNPGGTPVTAAMRVDNQGADGYQHCKTVETLVRPGQSAVLRCRFTPPGKDRFWGMRGIPLFGPVGSGPQLDLSAIVAFQVFVPRPEQAHTLLLERAWLEPVLGRLDAEVPMPFINRFGQYMHADWPGKLNDEEELVKRRERERKTLDQAPALADRDAWGGWTEGPTREATGWFRTEQVDGKWWLVTPDGSLFFSNGIDCVGTWSQTFVEGRTDWFAWLPEAEDPVFGSMYGHHEGAHRGAEPISGKGRTFRFYAANLARKYGEGWPGSWRATAYDRLRAWGFNTIGNWSQHDVLEHSPVPYVVGTGVNGVRLIEGATGYWSKMKDVFAPEFPEKAEAGLRWAGERHGENPMCIGYFVDNELAWEGIMNGLLSSPADQPARKAFVDWLKERHGGLEKLNEAWGAAASDWNALRLPEKRNETVEKDLDEFLYVFARRYFEVVRDACRKHAPNQLYLGCRFSSAPEPVVRACAEIADVVSFNIYRTKVNAEQYTGEEAPGAPIIIGEFHFGALDRGMFHTGLVPVESQQARAEAYKRYVRSVADHPAYVGCHWFQWVDEPTTGRWFDGENYNIGFVDITDTPYPELVEAAREVHAEVYPRRYGAALETE